MQIQVNSDNHIQSSKRLEEWVRTTIESTLDRYEEDLTRVEVHLSDENAKNQVPMTCAANWKRGQKATNRFP